MSQIWCKGKRNDGALSTKTTINRVLDLQKEGPISAHASQAREAIIIVTPDEAERIISALITFTPEEIGSSAFLQMYGCDVERVAWQAHASAKAQDGNEYVVEQLIAKRKLSVLVRTLLSVEIWRTFILVLRNGSSDLLAKVEANGNSLRCSFILHVETTLVGLINLALFHTSSFEESLDGEVIVALIDYCARCMSALAAPVETSAMMRRQKKEDQCLSTAEDEIDHNASKWNVNVILHDALLSTEFITCVGAVSTARYLCENFDYLPLSGQTRILDTHDYMIMMVSLIEEPPWTRKVLPNQSSGNWKWEKWVDNKWTGILPEELLTVTNCEAQCWIALYHLTCSNACRAKYALNSFRKEQLLRVRKYLNDFLLDQLPILVDVMRYMDQLSLMSVPDTSTGHGSLLLMQEVALVRDEMIRGKDWEAIAMQQYESIFLDISDSTDPVLRQISDLYNLEGLDEIVDDSIQEKSSDLCRRPIERVSLTIDSRQNAVIELKPDNPGSVLKTADGRYCRMKLIPMKKDLTAVHVAHDSHVAAQVFFKDTFETRLLASEDIDLSKPAQAQAVISEAAPTKQWRQLGSIKERIVLQMCFSTISRSAFPVCYKLDQAFISQPF